MSSSIQMDGWREGNGKFDRRDHRLMTVEDVEKDGSGDFALNVRSPSIQGDLRITGTRMPWCEMDY